MKHKLTCRDFELSLNTHGSFLSGVAEVALWSPLKLDNFKQSLPLPTKPRREESPVEERRTEKTLGEETKKMVIPVTSPTREPVDDAEELLWQWEAIREQRVQETIENRVKELSEKMGKLHTDTVESIVSMKTKLAERERKKQLTLIAQQKNAYFLRIYSIDFHTGARKSMRRYKS